MGKGEAGKAGMGMGMGKAGKGMGMAGKAGKGMAGEAGKGMGKGEAGKGMGSGKGEAGKGMGNGKGEAGKGMGSGKGEAGEAGGKGKGSESGFMHNSVSEQSSGATAVNVGTHADRRSRSTTKPTGEPCRLQRHHRHPLGRHCPGRWRQPVGSPQAQAEQVQRRIRG